MTQPLDWLGHNVLFFGGKGGVGKTTCATAFALLASEAGKRTLMVSTDPAHSTSDILRRQLDNQPQRLSEFLWALEIDAEQEAEAYISGVKEHLRRVVKPSLRQEVERQVEMAKVSPGAEEAALFDRIAALMQDLRKAYDLIVFDTAPTGHTLRLLSLPELMEAWIDGMILRRKQVNQMSRMWRNVAGGTPDEERDPIEQVLEERRRKFVRMRRVLLEPGRTAFIFVLTAEKLPIVETQKAVRALRRHEIPVGGMIVNRVLPTELSEHSFWRSRRAQEEVYLEEIAETLGDLPYIKLPLLEHDVVGMESLREVVRYLRLELEKAST